MGIRFKTSKDELYEVDWRDIEILRSRDPEGRTVPGPDPIRSWPLLCRGLAPT
jgi:hypothetical protein